MITLVEVIASGFATFFNRVIATGLLGKGIFLVITTWIVSVLLSGVALLIQNLMTSMQSMDSIMSNFGDVGAVGLWIFGLFVVPYALPALAGKLVRFIIRRIPIIG
jgi:hypothetical protein